MSAPGFVYAIEAGDAVKIGWSANPPQRLSKLRSDNPLRPELIGVVAGSKDDEHELHVLLVHYRRHGDWFEHIGPVRALTGMMPPPAVKRRSLHRSRQAEIPVFKTGLHRYLFDHDIGFVEFARAMGTSRENVYRWALGQRLPRPKQLAAITKATSGAVTANDFHACS